MSYVRERKLKDEATYEQVSATFDAVISKLSQHVKVRMSPQAMRLNVTEGNTTSSLLIETDLFISVESAECYAIADAQSLDSDACGRTTHGVIRLCDVLEWAWKKPRDGFVTFYHEIYHLLGSRHVYELTPSDRIGDETYLITAFNTLRAVRDNYCPTWAGVPVDRDHVIMDHVAMRAESSDNEFISKVGLGILNDFGYYNVSMELAEASRFNSGSCNKTAAYRYHYPSNKRFKLRSLGNTHVLTLEFQYTDAPIIKLTSRSVRLSEKLSVTRSVKYSFDSNYVIVPASKDEKDQDTLSNIKWLLGLKPDQHLGLKLGPDRLIFLDADYKELKVLTSCEGDCLYYQGHLTAPLNETSIVRVDFHNYVSSVRFADIQIIVNGSVQDQALLRYKLDPKGFLVTDLGSQADAWDRLTDALGGLIKVGFSEKTNSHFIKVVPLISKRL